MANLPPGAEVRLGPAVRAVVQATTAAGTAKRARTGVLQFERFHDFCASYGYNITPQTSLLAIVPVPVPLRLLIGFCFLRGKSGGVVRARAHDPHNLRAHVDALLALFTALACAPTRAACGPRTLASRS